MTALVRRGRTSGGGDAARLLGECAGSSVLSLLELLARDPDETVRLGAAEGIGFVGEERAAQVLLRLIADTQTDVRSAAVAALGRMKYAGAIPSIVQCLRSDPELVPYSGCALAGHHRGYHCR